MIALLKACLFFNPCARAELHQQKRARKLCSATLKSVFEKLRFRDRFKAAFSNFLVKNGSQC